MDARRWATSAKEGAFLKGFRVNNFLKKSALVILSTFVGSIALASVSVTINGTGYTIPTTGEKGWGSAVTTWIQAASSHLLQKSGGTFTLGAEVDFGASYGLKSTYLKSRALNPASTGTIRLGNTEGIYWRNAGNSANFGLTVDASNILTFNGNPLVGSSALTANHAVITTTGGQLTTEATLAPARGGTGQDLSGATGVPYVTAGTFSTESQVAGTRGGTGASNAGVFTYGANNVTLTTSGATSLTLPTSGTVVTLDSSGTLTNKTFDADGTGNSISNIENADIKAGAAIARSKIATGTANHVLINDNGSGLMTSEAQLAVSRGGTGQSTTTAAMDALSPLTTKGDILTRDLSNNIRVGVGSADQILVANSLLTPGLQWVDQPSSANGVDNLGIMTAVGGGVMSVTIVTGAGNAPASGSDTVTVSFRSSTQDWGRYYAKKINGYSTFTISSGSTLGMVDGVEAQIYVYAIDTGGDPAIGLSRLKFDDGVLQSTVAEGGAGAADSNRYIYSASAYTNVPIKVIGKIKVTQATAGSWVTAPSYVGNGISDLTAKQDISFALYKGSQTITDSTTTLVTWNGAAFDPLSGFNNASDFWVAPRSGKMMINAGLVYNPDTVGDRNLLIYLNGSLLREIYTGASPSASAPSQMLMSVITSVSAGDQISVKTVQTSGGDLAITSFGSAANSNFLEGYYID
jgi:hypothetical protein